MGWEDRQYYRDGDRTPRNLFRTIFGGSVPFFTAFGIRVRIHASLIVLIVTVILFDYTKGYSLRDRAVSMGMLAIVIILHEFGHCFAARSVGGDAEDILLWPLGGLAYARPPHRPWPTFVTVAGGPLVNALICLVCAIVIESIGGGAVSLNPFNISLPQKLVDLLYHGQTARFWVGYYFFWLFLTSYILFLFNLLPMFPLDGGQMLQAALWPKLGHYRSMYFACISGMVIAVPLGIFGILNGLNLMLVCIAVIGFLYCRSRLMQLKEVGPDEFDYSSGADFSASLRPDAPAKRRRKVSRWTVNRLRRQSQRDAAEQQMIDNILAKVSAHGMHSLTWSERRALKRATERQRRRDLELSRKE